MLRAFCGAANNAVCAVASEEEPLPRSCADVMGYHVSSNGGGDGTTATSTNILRVDGSGGGPGGGNYVAVFDPIDGSKNIDASLPVGTIFGIYRCPPEIVVADKNEEGHYQQQKQQQRGWNINSFLQRGTKLVAAGYCLYSATTVLVLTLGSGVHGFTLDPDRQTFLQTHPNMRIPDVGSLYSFNEANSRDYSEPVKEFLKTMKETGKMG